MACSKIFSGDLAELTEEIIQYFRKDFLTLYSCILVNRLWCRLAIPLLWEDPFSKNYPKNYHFIEIYLNKLNEDDKAKFNEYGIEYDLLHSNTLFNYLNFIKYLDTYRTYRSINYWIDSLVVKYDNKLRYKLENLVYRSLFEVFIKNEVNIHSFGINHYTFGFSDDNMDLVLQNPNLTYNMRNLILIVNAISSRNIFPFLKFLCSNCNSISSIVVNFPACSSSLIETHLSQIIISQHNLKKISFESNFILYNPFLSLKNSNCSNTLNTIIFYYTDFKNILTVLQEVFNQLNVLESVHIFYCCSLNSDFVQQIIKVIKPFKLRSLFMSEILHVESLQLLLQKFSDCLENFGFHYGYREHNEYDEKQRQSFKLIMKYCTKIRYFNLGISDDNNIYPFIENNRYNINYLTIEVDFHDDYTGLSSTVLQNLGQVLPSKLKYLCLSLAFKTNDLEIFLKNSQNTYI
ncbi:hypothetical protein GLOIN_2v1875595 [Rhizophagus irregularis DAOM 181602=DAOM 197198]|uniref:F-box domain-containing protein n=2 Tax=Rhizophagus irregularis (strain DAOM 181602 / DAOM 197198 / MUCL 43194) TaxID=747089 RepID=A0A2H5U552_RHIID|nr:hypothetical protein GLOIN_2v1875595 [Rhizophagus irregularis DAOM 181602=DAOM 197198]POG71891.1 hypothetical protein GLOIN_2v1875595 [Rhizophagus irregularis DAOM 181602=DAOM 197198]|eukprot:XP_025178757.1 hypothetical protein GLOIN_2v1875595 [Rhizophagus irregularis DAOM 181602=DAOM 197198]